MNPAEAPLKSVAEAPALSLAELPNSQEVAIAVLEHARPLRDDAEYRACFYCETGVVPTPLEEADSINGSPILLKKEFLQASGAYKQRGARHAALQATAETIVSYSTGNHGRSIVNAGISLGKRVILELPETMSPAKRIPLEALAGNPNNLLSLNFHKDFPTAQAAATAREEPGTAVIPPFGHLDVLAGQCSIGYEIVEELIARGLQDEHVVIPVSVAGGGLLAGIALPIWQAKCEGRLGSQVRVVGVQPEKTDALGRAVAKVQANEEPAQLFMPGELDTDCDALAIGEESLNPLTVAVAADKDMVSEFTTIDKLSLAYARQYASSQAGTQLEPAAALATAYALREANGAQLFILPLTGSNLSLETRSLYDDLVIANDRLLYQEASRVHVDRTSRHETIVPVVETFVGELATRPVRDWARLDNNGAMPSFFERRTTNALGGTTAAYRQGSVTPVSSRLRK